MPACAMVSRAMMVWATVGGMGWGRGRGSTSLHMSRRSRWSRQWRCTGSHRRFMTDKMEGVWRGEGGGGGGGRMMLPSEAGRKNTETPMDGRPYFLFVSCVRVLV